MEKRVYNFSSGPAVMPLPVLERAREEMLALGDTGISVMELSHRSSRFGEILANAEIGLRSLLDVPDNYRILFIQGGASLQFSMVPMNYCARAICRLCVSGTWGEKAIAQAAFLARRRRSIVEGSLFTSSGLDELSFSADASYVHYRQTKRSTA